MPGDPGDAALVLLIDRMLSAVEDRHEEIPGAAPAIDFSIDQEHWQVVVSMGCG